MLMSPEPPKKEEDIADAIERWCEQERRLLANGEEYKLQPVFSNGIEVAYVDKEGAIRADGEGREVQQW